MPIPPGEFYPAMKKNVPQLHIIRMHLTYLKQNKTKQQQKNKAWRIETLLCDCIYLKFEPNKNECLVLEVTDVVTLGSREWPGRNMEISKLLDGREMKQVQSQLG